MSDLIQNLLQQSEHVAKAAAAYIPAQINTPTTRKAAGILAGLVVLRQLNGYLNRRALNNNTPDPTWDWKNEIVLVTGGTSGIGEHMVRQFAERGIKVVVLDLNPPKTPFPANVFFYQADITSTETVHEVALRIRKEVGEVTVLINNAGIGNAGSIIGKPEKETRKIYEVNHLSHYVMVREFLPNMIFKNHGHVVTIASMASFTAPAMMVDYACTKAAALAFHEGLTQELKHVYKSRRIRTSIVHPSWIRTPLTADLIKQPYFKDSVMEPQNVAREVVNRVLKGNGFQLIIPSGLSWVSGLRGFPNWIQETLRDASGGRMREASQLISGS